MSFSEQAQAYWDGEHIRYLAEGNKVPSVEERVKSAFDAGVKAHHGANWFSAFTQLDAIGMLDKTQINFPRTEL